MKNSHFLTNMFAYLHISCKNTLNIHYYFFILVGSYDFFCDLMFFDLVTPSRSYKNNWVGYFDLSYDFILYDLDILSRSYVRS